MIGGWEERLITVVEGHLVVIKAYGQQKLGMWASQLPDGSPKGIVKSITPLERLFMVDIVAPTTDRGEFQLVLHFVNESRDIKLSPLIKKYSMINDIKTKEFLT